MYAIIESGSKQYRVKEGDVIEVELLHKKDGDVIEIKEVLLLNDGTSINVGTPYVEKCVVSAKVLEETKGPKVISFKYKKRKNYRRKKGHRQRYSKLQITKINKE